MGHVMIDVNTIDPSKRVKVCLDSIDKVKAFVNTITQYGCDMDLVAENQHYVIDAKSIMGIFSLDLSKNLTLIIISSDTNEIDRVKAAVKPFAV